MNLEDVIDPEYGLQQDEWSLKKLVFGKENQLEVVGWSGRNNSVKWYIVKCLKCSGDKELYGDGYFRVYKSNLLKPVIPCGCGANPRHTKEHYKILCKRVADTLGFEFLNFKEKWRGSLTNIVMRCPNHGVWETGCISTLINQKSGCPLCARDFLVKAATLKNTKDDVDMIDSFFASGVFHPDTKFWRSDSRTKQGRKTYWFVLCPDCGEISESQSGNLRRGQKPCGCSSYSPKIAYVNTVSDGTNMIAVKFGVTVNLKRRLWEQSSKSSLIIAGHSAYLFGTTRQCRDAERGCLSELECGIISERDMPDGYTETTWPCNLDKIIEIYERNGGIKIENTY